MTWSLQAPTPKTSEHHLLSGCLNASLRVLSTQHQPWPLGDAQAGGIQAL